jgi:hypothetical protein
MSAEPIYLVTDAGKPGDGLDNQGRHESLS